MTTGEMRVSWVRVANLTFLWAIGLFFVWGVTMASLTRGLLGDDAYAYWLTGHVAELYRNGPATEDAFLYSPAFAALIHPLTLLPWPVFLAAWLTVEGSALVWLLRPLPLRWAVPVGLFCLPELALGNIYLMLAAMVALGVRYPAVWAFGILTKITPGVGLVWFAARGEWRKLAVASGVTVTVVAGSYALAPQLWHQWVGFLLGHGGDAPGGTVAFLARCLVSAGLVAFAARTDRRWLLAVAVTLAFPVLNAYASLAVLAAIPRLWEARSSRPLRVDVHAAETEVAASAA